MKKVTIIGGGLAGLITAIQLARAQVSVQLFEKKKYPFHRVCGEYISNEVVPFLSANHLFPETLCPSSINKFQLTSTNGRSADLPLDLGGFGISRFAFDSWLFHIAVSAGVTIHQQEEIIATSFQNEKFQLHSKLNQYQSDVVVGSFGKRSKIDLVMNRSFTQKRSPYVGVKYHIKYDHPEGLIALHNFKNGYCGISDVENGVTNLCYLTHRDSLKKEGSIKSLEENILYENPFLKEIFQHAEFLWDQPETINEISFETKNPVESHILMSGDAAGMITPLCGNGMAMAIHSAKILSELLIQYCRNEISRAELENTYATKWRNQFATRLWVGRQFQKLFGGKLVSSQAVSLGRNIKPVAHYLISKTHGKPFQ